MFLKVLLTSKYLCFIEFRKVTKLFTNKQMNKQINLEGPNMGILDAIEDLANLREASLMLAQINGVASLEINLHQYKPLIVLT